MTSAPNIKIAAYQITPAKTTRGRKQQLQTMIETVNSASIDFVCLPEGFLTGYFANKQQAMENSLELGSEAFEEWLEEFSICDATVIVGFNERTEGLIFDSAAIIEKGKLLGVQRKHYVYHNYFASGSFFSLFHRQGIPFGVTICLDTNYFEPSRILALQGAAILFSPMCNRVPLDHPYARRPSYYSHFVARSFENRCWLVSADWVWQSEGGYICPGHSVIYDPDGKEMLRSAEMKEELLIQEIPKDRLFLEKGLRVLGSRDLNYELNKLRGS